MFACDVCGATNASPAVDEVLGEPGGPAFVVQMMTEGAGKSFICPACRLDQLGEDLPQKDWDNYTQSNKRACVPMRGSYEDQHGDHDKTSN